mmetsp:Transcript_62955/g.148305  ORF Transcript_62955/g.148305 Transcript_62955/m.148305 type:complete len:306 (-) Transcript_62955:636-1553(-)
MEDEGGIGASDADEGRHPAARRADQPSRRQERRLARGLPQQPHRSHLHDGFARLRLPRPRVHAHHSLREEPQAQDLPREPEPLRPSPARGQGLLPARLRDPHLHPPRARFLGGGEVEGQGDPEDAGRLVHVPWQHCSDCYWRYSSGLALLARGRYRAQRRRQEYHHQAPHGRAQGREGDCVEAPQHAHRLCGAARVPPLGKAPREDTERVHPVAVRGGRGQGGAEQGRAQDFGRGAQEDGGGPGDRAGERQDGEAGRRGHSLAPQAQVRLRVRDQVAPQDPRGQHLAPPRQARGDGVREAGEPDG